MGSPQKRTPRHARAALNRAVDEALLSADDVVGLDDLGSLGIDRRAADRRVAAGTLYRAGRKAYSGRPRGWSARAQRRAAVLGKPGRKLAFVTAAAHLDLDRVRRGDEIHVLREGGGAWKQTGLRLHRATVLPPMDFAVIDGLPCTTAARTLLDCASMVDAARLDDMVDRSVEIRLYDGTALSRVITDRPNARGRAKLEAALARLDETAGHHRNAFERRTTALAKESLILPTPVVNAPLGHFRPDVGWIDTRALVECDGRDYHRSPAQILADEAREVALLAAGYVILRLRWEQVVYEPARTLRRLEAFYQANAVPPSPGLPGRIVF